MTAMIEKDFGRYLQTCRQARGIALDVVSHQTKIPLAILRQIENENMDHLPEPVYVKGFLKAFAFAVDANPEEVLNRFENRSACSALPFAKPAASPTFFKGWQRLLLVLVLFSVQIYATLYLSERMRYYSADTPMEPPMAGQTVAISPEVAQAPPSKLLVSLTAAVEEQAATDERPPEPVPRQSDERPSEPMPRLSDLELKMTAVEATWLKVVTDDGPPREFLLLSDQKVTLAAKRKFDLVIGNAGGVRLMLNDQPVPIVGKHGEVVDLHLP